MSECPEALLKIRSLRIAFPSPSGKVLAVNHMNLEVAQGEIVALVGESGCGKSTLARSIILPTGTIENGEIYFQGRDLCKKSRKEMEAIREKKSA